MNDNDVDDNDNPLKYFVGDPEKSIVKSTHPWDRWPGESARAYHAYCLYRDAGMDRRMIDVAHEMGMTFRSGQDGRVKTNKQMQDWVSKYKWRERCRQYDEYLEKTKRRTVERVHREMVERQARVGQSMTDLAQTTIDAGVVQPESIRDVVMLAEAGTRIERLARGESTENVAHGVKFVISHPLPPWVPENVKQLAEYVDEGEMENERSTDAAASDTDNQ